MTDCNNNNIVSVERDICTGIGNNTIHQLNKLDEKLGKRKRVRIYPITYIQAVYDAKTGTRLDGFLNMVNSIYLPWRGSAKSTRLQVPFHLRRKGLMISYRNIDNEIITEKCILEECIKDDLFKLDSSWVRITDALPVSGNVTIGSNGNWFVDGEDTGFKAQGPKGDNGVPLQPRLSEDGTKIEYSLDGEEWKELFPLSLITPNISFEEPVGLEPGATPTVENVGDGFNVNLQFGLPKAPEVNVGSTTTIGEGNQAKVTNSGTPYAPVLNFQIPKGDTGRGITIKGFYPDLSTLQEKITSPAIGDVYCVGTAEPYTGYVWTNVYGSESQTATQAWQSIGSINKDTTILVNELGDREDVGINQKSITNELYKAAASKFIEINHELSEQEGVLYLNLLLLEFIGLPYQPNVYVRSVTKNHETLGNMFELVLVMGSNKISVAIRKDDIESADLYDGKIHSKDFRTNINDIMTDYTLYIQFKKNAFSELEDGTIFYRDDNTNVLLRNCFNFNTKKEIDDLKNNTDLLLYTKYGYLDFYNSDLEKCKPVFKYIKSIKIKGVSQSNQNNIIGIYSLVFYHSTYKCRVGLRMIKGDSTISSEIVVKDSFDEPFITILDGETIEIEIKVKNNPSNLIAISEADEPWFILDKNVFVDVLDYDVSTNTEMISDVFGDSSLDIFLNPGIIYTDDEKRMMNSFKNIGFSNVPDSVRSHEFIIRTFSASSTVNTPNTYGAQVIIADKTIFEEESDWNKASITLIGQIPCNFGEYEIDVTATVGQLSGMRIKALIDFSQFKELDPYLYPTNQNNRLYFNINRSWRNHNLNDIVGDLLEREDNIDKISPNAWFPLEGKNVVFLGSSNVWGDGFLFYSYLKEAVDYLYKSSGAFNSSLNLSIDNATIITNNQKFLDGVAKKIEGLGSEIVFTHYGSELNVCQVIERTSNYAIIGVYDGDTKIAEFTNHNETIGSNIENFVGDGSKTKFELSRCFTYNHVLTVNNSLVTVQLNTQGYGATFPDGVDALIIRGLNSEGEVVHSIWFKTAPASDANIEISYDYGETICFVKSTVGEDEYGVNESAYGDGVISYDPVHPAGISSGLDYRLVNEKSFFRYWFDSDEKRRITLKIEGGENPYFIFNFASSVFHNIMNAGIGGYTAEKFNTEEDNPTTSWRNIADYFTPDWVSIGLTGNDDWNNFPRKIHRNITMTLAELQSYPSLEIQKIEYNQELNNYTVTVNSGTIASITRTSLTCDSIKNSSVVAGDFARIGTYTGDLRQVQTRKIETVNTETGEITWDEPLHLNEYLCIDSLTDLVGQDVSIRSIDNYMENMNTLICNIKRINPKCKICLFNVYYVDMWNRNVSEYPYIQYWVAEKFDDSVFVVDAWKYARDYCELSRKTSIVLTADGSSELSFESPNNLGHIEGIEVWVNNKNVYGKDCYFKTGWYYSVDTDLSGSDLNWEGSNTYLRPKDNRIKPKIIWVKNIPIRDTQVEIRYATRQWSSDYAHPNSGNYISNSLGRALVYALQR